MYPLRVRPADAGRASVGTRCSVAEAALALKGLCIDGLKLGSSEEWKQYRRWGERDANPYAARPQQPGTLGSDAPSLEVEAVTAHDGIKCTLVHDGREAA